MNSNYAYKNNDAEVMRSSSGGAFIGICYAFEKQYGIGNCEFYGASYDDQMCVKHTRVSRAMDCHIFQGSKYVRSDCNQIFVDVMEQIHLGKKILFSGTPCQIYALKVFLNKNKKSLQEVLTIDLICHGTPQKNLWIQYKKWLEQKAEAKMIAYSFRYKPEGWKAYPAYAEFENGVRMVNTADTSVFSKLHMERYSITIGCFSCPFAKQERVSDITLGDYWGIEKVIPSIPSKTGVSLIMANTDHARIIVEAICRNDSYLEKTKDTSFFKYQHNLNSPTEKPEDYEQFWADYEKMNFERLLKKYINYGKKYKIIFSIKKLIRKSPFIEMIRKKRG